MRNTIVGYVVTLLSAVKYNTSTTVTISDSRLDSIADADLPLVNVTDPRDDIEDMDSHLEHTLQLQIEVWTGGTAALHRALVDDIYELLAGQPCLGGYVDSTMIQGDECDAENKENIFNLSIIKIQARYTTSRTNLAVKYF